MERELLDILVSIIKELSGNFDEVIDRFIKIYEKSSQAVDYSGEIQQLNEEVDKINRKKDKLLEYNLDGKISDVEVVRRNDSLNDNLKELETEINKLNEQQNNNRLQLNEIYGIKKNLTRFSVIEQEDLTQNVINLFVDKILAEPIDEHHMILKIILITGEAQSKVYEKAGSINKNACVRSGYMFKKMIEAQERSMADKSMGSR